MALAFTTGQRMQVRYYLGWSARFHQFDSRLEQALNALESNSLVDPDTLNLIVAPLTATPPGILASLADIDTRLNGSYTRIEALELGAIKLPGPMEIGMLRSEGRRFVGRLAALLGVEVRQDVFSGRLPRQFASARGMVPGTGGGNLPPVG